ncbi:chromodomain helicase DNA binding protein [Trifolium pratense]|uniref:Chromodomain helicase DNA binding protein n=1 Tax=Trifolium pratense TaxID=57577 RepID=A0A2K3KZD4_TRIPR|nr:chromodomain helicase DNA binding protein [Trifolium pratense]
MKVRVKQLRITQDWDESTENCLGETNLVYVRMIKDFAETIREWTCNGKELWSDMVVEIIGDHYNLTIHEVRLALNLPKNLLEEGSSEPPDNVYCDAAGRGNEIGSEIGITNKPKENGDSSNMLDADQNCGSTRLIPLVKAEVEKENILHEEPESQKEISC